MDVWVLLAKNSLYDWWVCKLGSTRDEVNCAKIKLMNTAFRLDNPKFRIIKRQMTLPRKYSISNKKGLKK